MPILTTERLLLRPLASSDAPQVFALRSHPVVNQYLDRDPCGSEAEALAFIKKIQGNVEADGLPYWVISKMEDEALIGTICLYPGGGGSTEIGFELLPRYGGMGYMREAVDAVLHFAFHRLQLSAVEACTHPGNAASIRVLTHFGFEPTGQEGNLLCYRLHLTQWA